MSETMKAWQCIGCGRLEGPQNCIGVCRDRKVELVYASELADAEERLVQARLESAALRALVLKLAGTKPREGQWEKSWRSMQEQARDLLAKHPDAGTASAVAFASDRAADEPASRVREA